jgi:flagellar hook-associated protein 2
VTQGIADSVRRTLKSITDPFEGLVATRENAIDETIKSAQNQIVALNTRIALKESTLLKQFTAMETAVAEFNSIGSFLGAQLASLPSASSRR